MRSRPAEIVAVFASRRTRARETRRSSESDFVEQRLFGPGAFYPPARPFLWAQDMAGNAARVTADPQNRGRGDGGRWPRGCWVSGVTGLIIEGAAVRVGW